MKTTKIIFALIENLTLEEETTFNYFDWTVTNDRKIIIKNIPDLNSFMVLSGRIAMTSLQDKTVAFQLFSFDDNEPLNLVHSESSNLNGYLSLMWLFDDNSVFSSMQISQDIKTYDVQINRRESFVSNSLGMYDDYNLKSLDIPNLYSAAIKNIDILMYMETKSIGEVNHNTKKYHSHRADLENKISRHSRIQRSFLILNIARATSFLPMKIAFYINVLECLLLSNDAELSLRLQLFGANLIGESKSDRNEIRDTIRDAYGIRSTFFHGSALKPNQTKSSQDVSNKIDNIVRRIINKAILNHTIFNGNQTKRDEFLNDMIIS